MRIKDKPATPTPSRLLGTILLIGGGVFLGDFFWAIATYSPSITAAGPAVWTVLASGVLAGAVLVGVGVATVLHSTDHLEIAANVDWNL
ncbi:hypothetical protein [Halorientalis halophila]|jgi:hypothetical protein|uniref:hypothetical protein n=1 Tax=Halorientalis halophila TaxID=3108499 RepID=UPI00300A8474